MRSVEGLNKLVTNPEKETRIKMSDIANPSPVFSIYDQWRDQWDKKKDKGGKANGPAN